MTSTSRLIIPIVLLAAAAGAGYFLLAGHDEPVTIPRTEAPPPENPPDAPVDGMRVSATELARVAEPAPVRTEIEVDTSGSAYAQGVRGVVLAPDGRPARGVQVFLMESGTGTDIFRMMQMAQSGITLPPVAGTDTDDKGQFALGLQLVEPNKVYEVRIVSDMFADLNHPGVRMREGEWYDTGSMQLKNGLALVGQVTAANSAGMPVADAQVWVKSATTPFEISFTPGREQGLEVRTDSAGFYRVPNVGAGVHHVTAVAPGFARVTQSNVTISEDGENRINFELPRGKAIAGTVLDSAGKGIAAAKVTAIAISSKTPLTADTRSDESGRFEILGLVEGPYQLTGAASGYIDAVEKPILAGTEDVELILEKQGSARVRVLGKNGQVLRRYALTVKTYFQGAPAAPPAGPDNTNQPPAEPSYGNTMIPVKQVDNPKDGIAVVEGIDPGNYVFQVNANGYAMAFSAPFTIAVEAEPPLVEVVMNEGGVIEGLVVSAAGSALQGVRVETRPNDLDDNPFTQMFASMIPTKVTRTTVQTDAEGRFRIPLLNPGQYQVKFSHPQYVETSLKGNQVLVGQTTTLQPVRMAVGCVLTGTVRVEGKPTAQVKVQVSRKADPNQNPAEMPNRMAMFSCDAFTDQNGRYTMTKRLPPGLYEVMAAQQTLENPLFQIVQFQKSKQEITVSGQAELVVDFQLDGLQ